MQRTVATSLARLSSGTRQGSRAFGVDVYEAVTGRYPYDGRDWGSVDLDERRTIACRLLLATITSIVLVTLSVGIETMVMIRLVVSGGSLIVAGEPYAAVWPFPVALAVSGAAEFVLAYSLLRPHLRWFRSGADAGAARRRSVQLLPIRQAAVTAGSWALGAVLYIILCGAYRGVDVLVVLGALTLAGVSASCVTYMVIERASRPLAAAAMADADFPEPRLGIRQRMLVIWLVCSAVPLLGMVLINIGRAVGWVPGSGSSIDVPIVTLAVICLSSGARSIALVSQSLTDPLRGMRRVIDQLRVGDFDARVDVYDSSELGMVQHDFNEMVAGVAEREHIRDLFERHVGGEVARQAVENGVGLQGGNTHVGVLFVDIAGSTQFAEEENPEIVAETLNSFFSIVAEVVDTHHGFINKFEGDAALAVFGAPIELADPAAAALAAARDLGAALQALPLHCGIGVSAGTVFAGNIGAESRYEYTVIGDPVNECARLSEIAKNTESNIIAGGRAVCAETAETLYDPVAAEQGAYSERGQWASIGTVQLRGRSNDTEVFAPAELVADLRVPDADSIDDVAITSADDMASDFRGAVADRATGLIGSLVKLPLTVLRQQR
ncbi:adenylate/guanylate cyclase domain-containing protein [Williamsia sterculiae]|uniref:Adenylate cyclase, class 3 n=1 Tax=Williamsia sterculiae TaxID=1344003 RepID=A0A1N7GWP4_9NOCA|nr:adenylate/guanylate cyclase domain-containing protein [Williamsia sterculiae]SIS17011.1 Adenylate cyclase, class 3 [Williamsia sterculiae]